jgi:hypothetical protein
LSVSANGWLTRFTIPSISLVLMRLKERTMKYHTCKTHNREVMISTGIHGGTTYGHGELDTLGFWEIDCPEGEKYFEDRFKAEEKRKRDEQNDKWISKYSGG